MKLGLDGRGVQSHGGCAALIRLCLSSGVSVTSEHSAACRASCGVILPTQSMTHTHCTPRKIVAIGFRFGMRRISNASSASTKLCEKLNRNPRDRTISAHRTASKPSATLNGPPTWPRLDDDPASAVAFASLTLFAFR